MTNPTSNRNSQDGAEHPEGVSVDLEDGEAVTTSHDDPSSQPPTGAGDLTVPPDYVPRRRSDVLELDMGDGAILYDDDSSLVHHLNPSATLIWHLCDGSGSAQELARDIAEEYGLDPSTVGEQVMTVIVELDALGLVEDGRGPDDGSTDRLRHAS